MTSGAGGQETSFASCSMIWRIRPMTCARKFSYLRREIAHFLNARFPRLAFARSSHRRRNACTRRSRWSSVRGSSLLVISSTVQRSIHASGMCRFSIENSGNSVSFGAAAPCSSMPNRRMNSYNGVERKLRRASRLALCSRSSLSGPTGRLNRKRKMFIPKNLSIRWKLYS